MSKPYRNPDWQRAIILLTGTAIGVVTIVGLYWAQAVLIPLALAIFLTFLLNPLVKLIQSRGLGRIPAVVVVVALAAVGTLGLGWLLSRQAAGLLNELPAYTANIKAKLKTLRTLGSGEGSVRLERMIEELTAELSSQPAIGSDSKTSARRSPTYVVTDSASAWSPQLPPQLAGFLQTLASLALSFVLVVFMLLEREDLRNRFIRLMGKGRVTLTTKVVDEAAHRISRYLLVQALINGGYGIILAALLLVLGVDYAILWGFLAATLRYIPYIGAWIAAIFPVAMTLAVFDTWWPLVVLVTVLIILELVTNNVVEPWLYGQSMGVSSVALIVAAAFFAMLWGPLGMVLSAPLTVCLVVLGKYIPQLEFFDILLSDKPALDRDVSFYQRLLAHDQDEATDLVLSQAKGSNSEQVYDDLLIPALNSVKRDREQDELSEQDERYILTATREILEDLGDRWSSASAAAAAVKTDETAAEMPTPKRLKIFGCPARDEADRLGLEMLRQILDPARWEMEVTPVGMLTSELVALVAKEQAPLVCIGTLPPGGLAHTRYLCKRLRASSPQLKIIVGRWGLSDETREEKLEQLRESGADLMVTTLQGTRDQLSAWHPVFSQDQSPAVLEMQTPRHAPPVISPSSLVHLPQAG